MIFAQMLEIVALNDLASVFCARKFSFDPRGIYPPPRDLSIARLLHFNAIFGAKIGLNWKISNHDAFLFFTIEIRLKLIIFSRITKQFKYPSWGWWLQGAGWLRFRKIFRWLHFLSPSPRNQMSIPATKSHPRKKTSLLCVCMVFKRV